MGITHEWNGTVLTITSDSGSSSADLRGEKGDTGIRGPQGVKGNAGEINYGVLDNYATEEFVKNAVADAQIPDKEVDLTGYYAKSEANRTFANALKGNKSGATVTATDVNPIEHELDIKLISEKAIANSLDISKITSTTTLTNNGDGTLTLNFNSSSATYGIGLGGTLEALCPDIADDDCPTFYFEVEEEEYKGKVYISYGPGSVYDGEAKTLTGWNWGSIKTVMPYIYLTSGTTYTNPITIKNFQIGAKTGAPIISDFSNVSITRQGKNILPYPYYSKSFTTNGITFTINEDGSVTANGTTPSDKSADFYFYLDRNNMLPLKDKTVTFSGCPGGGSTSTYYIAVSGTNTYLEYGEGKTQLFPHDCHAVYIRIAKGATVNNVVFKPQIEYGSSKTEYEPYVEPLTALAEEDGTVKGVMSLYPTTALATDATGVTIDMAYNRDINKAFAELQQAIISLGGNI